MARASDAGFSLVEALVAMVILAVGAVALLATTESHVGRIGELTDRTAARWVAENRLAELRLGIVPPPGRVEMLGLSWTVDVRATGTDDPDLSRVDIRVGSDGSDLERRALALLTGYVDTGAPGRSTP